MPAKRRARVGHVDDEPVRIKPRDKRRRAVVFDDHGVLYHRCVNVLHNAGNGLFPYGAEPVLRIHEAGVVRGDPPAILLLCEQYFLPFLFSEVDDSYQDIDT